jgi:hypothetical protein
VTENVSVEVAVPTGVTTMTFALTAPAGTSSLVCAGESTA